MKTFETGGPVEVSVECAAGEVRVATADAARAEVDVTALRDDDVSREAVAATLVELRDDRLVVEVPKREGRLFGREPKVRVDVRVPHGSGLSFRTASADVAAGGRLAGVRGRTASGDVRVDEAATVRLETASGDLRVGTVRGPAGLKTASGDIELGHATGPVEASVVSGDLRVRAADEGASLSAVSGDVAVESVARGDVEVRTVSGNATVGVRTGARVHVDVSTVSGDLQSEVELDETPAEGEGPLVEVRGRTVSGDFRVRRSTAQ